MYIGVDGGGTKTAFLLLDDAGTVRARHSGGSAYYPEVTMEGVRALIAEGIGALIEKAGITPTDVDHAFFGLPCFGEDPVEDKRLAQLPSGVLSASQYTCGNDMVCSWAGSLACADGISVVAGTGSIAYGEYAGRNARAGGWGEVFSDEGSAYWIAREGLTAFSRMSDGRDPMGPLHEMLMSHFELRQAIDLAGKINGLQASDRSGLAQVSKIVANAARAGDKVAALVFTRAGAELAALVAAVKKSLKIPAGLTLPVSYTGGVFGTGELILAPLREALNSYDKSFELRAPLLEPVLGAALYAARCRGVTYPKEILLKLAPTIDR